MKISRFKKCVSVVLAGSVLFGFTGCMNFGSKKAVLEAAYDLADLMVSADASKLIKNSTLDKKSSEAGVMTNILSSETYTDNENAFFQAVESTFEYTIDEESIEVEKDEATIDIIFTMADYKEVLEDQYTNVDDLVKAVEKVDTTEYKFTAEFVKEDKEWIPDNVGSKKFLKLYDYRNTDLTIGLTADMISGMINRSMSTFWMVEDDGSYQGTFMISYDYYFDSEILNYADCEQYVYFTLSLDGSVIYTGDDTLLGNSTSLTCRVDSENVGYDKGALFDPGSYTIDLYLHGFDGDELIDSETVEVKEASAPTTSGNQFEGENVYMQFQSAAFREEVIRLGWHDGSSFKFDYSYSTDAPMIDFSLQVNPDCTRNITFSYCYSETMDAAALDDALANPIYAGMASPIEYADGVFYDLKYEFTDTAAAGYYIVFAFDSTTNESLFFAFCEVGL